MLPNFYVLGAQKAGTTWLFNTLSTHPEVGHAVNKEVHFFDRADRIAKGINWYAEKFESVPENAAKIAIGDFTPKYLRMVHPDCFLNQPLVPHDAISHIKEHTPDARFIVVLRNPTRRALSAYNHYLRKGRIAVGEKLFESASELDLLLAGRYAEQLEIWFTNFPREQFLILIYEEDIEPDTAKQKTFAQVCEFIGVDANFVAPNIFNRFNHSLSGFQTRLLIRGGRLQKWLWKAPRFIQKMRIWDVGVSSAEITQLHEYYQEPNQKLSELLGRELPW